jgi:hypothetical protein
MKVLLQRSKLSHLVHVLLSSPLLAASNIDIHVMKKRKCQDSCTQLVNDAFSCKDMTHWDTKVYNL